MLLIATDVAGVCLDWGGPGQRLLAVVPLDRIEALLDGSAGAQVQADTA